jgi:hypothetical protein
MAISKRRFREKSDSQIENALAIGGKGRFNMRPWSAG